MNDTPRTCDCCRHSTDGPIDPNNLGAPRQLLCRRHPPVPMLVGTPGGGVATLSQWPAVPPGGTCGEWAPSHLTIEH